jgi:hypothetical protein
MRRTGLRSSAAGCAPRRLGRSCRDARHPRPAAATPAPGTHTRRPPRPETTPPEPVSAPGQRPHDRPPYQPRRGRRARCRSRAANTPRRRSYAHRVLRCTAARRGTHPRQHREAPGRPAPVSAAHGTRPRHAPPPRAARGAPADRTLPARAGVRFGWSAGDVCQGLRRKTLRDVWDETRHGPSPVGVLRSRRRMRAGSSCWAAMSGQSGANTAAGQSLDEPGASRGAGRL